MKSILSRQFGLRIRELRKLRKWSQEEFAHRAELDRTYVSGIERGVRNPTLEIVGRLATGLGTPLGELLRDVEKVTLPKLKRKEPQAALHAKPKSGR